MLPHINSAEYAQLREELGGHEPLGFLDPEAALQQTIEARQRREAASIIDRQLQRRAQRVNEIAQMQRSATAFLLGCCLSLALCTFNRRLSDARHGVIGGDNV